MVFIEELVVPKLLRGGRGRSEVVDGRLQDAAELQDGREVEAPAELERGAGSAGASTSLMAPWRAVLTVVLLVS